MSRGMPPKLSSRVRRVNLVTPGELLDRIDEYRRGLPGIPNRSEAMRSLIEAGLEAAEGKRKKKGGKPE